MIPGGDSVVAELWALLTVVLLVYLARLYVACLCSVIPTYEELKRNSKLTVCFYLATGSLVGSCSARSENSKSMITS